MGSRWIVVLLVAGCGSVGDHKPGDAALADTPSDGEAFPGPASCFAIHTASPALPSGTYMIDPDGFGGEAPISVTCDMVTDGGGWTLVFFAPTEALDGLPITYTAGNARLMADAQHVLIAYRSATQVAYVNHARFDLPTAWRTQTPFGYPGDDSVTGVSLNGGALVTATVRYGRANFSNVCGDAWNPVSDYGRLCIVGTVAPYFSAFATTAPDECSDSSQAYNATPCTTDKRFSIAVR
jgi:hypothetical protein